MKIIGEKLSNQEMLALKGGVIYCQCGWEGSPVGPVFQFDTSNVQTAIQLAGPYCDSSAHGAAHCWGGSQT